MSAEVKPDVEEAEVETMADLLALLSRDLEPLPEKAPAEARLERSRELQKRLSGAASAAAECLWPGFEDVFADVLAREVQALEDLGRKGVGAA